MNGQLWGRRWRILVSKPATKNNPNEEEALNVSELHCTFEIHKKRGKGGFYAVCKIYNLTAATENKLIREGDRLIIEAGYDGTAEKDVTNADGTVQTETVPLQYGKIFDGRIIYPSRSKESNVDYILTLTAIDGDAPLNLNHISKTVNRGLNMRKVVETVCNDSEVKTPINTVSNGLSPQTLPRGKVFYGRPYDYVQDVCRGNSADYYIEDGQLNVVRLQDVAKDEALVVTPNNGLIGTPQQTQDGVSFKLLLNPAIHLGSMIQLKNVEINEVSVMPGQRQAPLDDDWIYQAIEITHRGDTRGNDWYTEVIGISRYGKGALPALLGDSGTNGMGV